MTITDWTRLVIACLYTVTTIGVLLGVHRALPSMKPIIVLGGIVTGIWSIWYWYLGLGNPALDQNTVLINHTIHFGTLVYVGMLVWKAHLDYVQRRG